MRRGISRHKRSSMPEWHEKLFDWKIYGVVGRQVVLLGVVISSILSEPVRNY